MEDLLTVGQDNMYKNIFQFCFMVVLSGCSSNTNIVAQMTSCNTVQDAAIYAGKAKALGENGVPLLLQMQAEIDPGSDSVLHIGKTNIIMKQLYELAEQGVYRVEEVPVILQVIKKQRYIGDTLIPAKTLLLITKIDVGYNESFVNNYAVMDEERRLRMLIEWQKWYENHKNAGGQALH